MINILNFHKYGFLDCRRLKPIALEANSWLACFNPSFLFIWSDLLKPEIAYLNNQAIIRYLDPDAGMVYIPPIGRLDLRQGIYLIREDAIKNGFDFNLSSYDNNYREALNKIRISSNINNDYINFIYPCTSLMFSDRKLYKKEMKAIKYFYMDYEATYLKLGSKDDFPQILEFINNHSRNIKNIYTILNMIKKAIEHLYELDLKLIMLRDEEKIFGFTLGSILGNTYYIHYMLYDNEIEGLDLALIQATSRYASSVARYINIEAYLEGEVKRKYLSWRPLEIIESFKNF